MASKPDRILQQFPGPVTLHPSRIKFLILLAGSLGFSVGGYYMVRDGASGGWFVLGFFGLCTLISVMLTLPGASGLTLDRDGFRVSSMYRRAHTRWRDAGGFITSGLPPSGYVMVVYDDATIRSGKLAAANIKLTGRNSGLPNTYGLEADELAELMVAWRERAMRSR